MLGDVRGQVGLAIHTLDDVESLVYLLDTLKVLHGQVATMLAGSSQESAARMIAQMDEAVTSLGEALLACTRASMAGQDLLTNL